MSNPDDLPKGIDDFEAKQAEQIQQAHEQDAATSTRFLTNSIVKDRRRTQLITLAVVAVAVGGILVAVSSMPSKPEPEDKKPAAAAEPSPAGQPTEAAQADAEPPAAPEPEDSQVAAGVVP